MEISIDNLKNMARAIFDKINPILGTEEASKKIKKGAGGDISMNVDILAENTVIEFLENLKANLLLISEEIGEKYIGDEKSAIQNQYKLIVDPIDGSYNAARGIPFCCASIAFAEGNNIDNIQKAVIVDLNSGDLFWAEKGQGAFLNDNVTSVSDRLISNNCVYEVDFGLRNLEENLNRYEALLKTASHIRIMGSCALSLCQLAKGSIDAFINFKSSMRLVDAAAGILIVREAGGVVMNFKGKNLEGELSINQRFSFVASNKKIGEVLAKELRKIPEC